MLKNNENKEKMQHLKTDGDIVNTTKPDTQASEDFNKRTAHKHYSIPKKVLGGFRNKQERKKRKLKDEGESNINI